MLRRTGETELEMAERQVRQVNKHIARQLEIIQRLRSDGYPTARAERVLANFENVRQIHEAHFKRLLGR